MTRREHLTAALLAAIFYLHRHYHKDLHGVANFQKQ
jgi:hypothetical protein